MVQPTKVIVLGTNKGGMGRTVTAVNLAAILAVAGRRTLLVDLDPKGEATDWLGVERRTESPAPECLIDPDRFLSECVSAPTPSGLDVWPGGPGLEDLQAELWQETPRTDLLCQGLQRARQRYGCIVVDAPASLSPLGQNALGAADVLLLPLTGAAFSRTALADTLRAAKGVCGQAPLVAGVRVAMRGEEAPTEQIRLDAAELVTLETPIAFDSEALRAASEEGVPVFEHAPGSRAARSFVELGREVLARVVDA